MARKIGRAGMSAEFSWSRCLRRVPGELVSGGSCRADSVITPGSLAWSRPEPTAAPPHGFESREALAIPAQLPEAQRPGWPVRAGSVTLQLWFDLTPRTFLGAERRWTARTPKRIIQPRQLAPPKSSKPALNRRSLSPDLNFGHYFRATTPERAGTLCRTPAGRQRISSTYCSPGGDRSRSL